MEKNAIEVREISKSYDVYDTPLARIRHAIWPRLNHGVKQVHALENISFDISQGEALGIIGRNGSGKSTLLEIITGTLEPTSGSVHVSGRIAGLLELGSGFNPEYSGRENVFLNGLLMGLDKASIEERFDDIVSFADIGDVLERPVKTYSSGMLVRLAFSVQVALQPDILIVDEALSVGDYFFQQKCFGRLRQMRDNGLTLLFVSHDMGSVRDLCSKAVYLNKGKMIFSGDSKLAISKYLSQAGSRRLERESSGDVSDENRIFEKDSFRQNFVIEEAFWKFGEKQSFNNFEKTRILAVQITNTNGEAISHCNVGQKFFLTAIIGMSRRDSGHVGLSIKNKFDQVVNSTTSLNLNCPAIESDDAEVKIFRFEIDCMLEAGLYSLMVNFAQPSGKNSGFVKDSTGWFGPFEVRWDYSNSTAPFLGMFGLPVTGRLVQLSHIV